MYQLRHKMNSVLIFSYDCNELQMNKTKWMKPIALPTFNIQIRPAHVQECLSNFYPAKAGDEQKAGRGQSWDCWPKLTKSIFPTLWYWIEYNIVFINTSWEKGGGWGMGEWEKQSLLVCLSPKANTTHPEAPLPRKRMDNLCCWEAENKYSCLGFGFLFVSTCGLWFFHQNAFVSTYAFLILLSPPVLPRSRRESVVWSASSKKTRATLMVSFQFLNIIISFCFQVPLLWETLNNWSSFTCSSLITDLLSSQILGLCGQLFLASLELHHFSCWKIYSLIPVNPKPGNLFSKTSSVLTKENEKASGF